MTEALPVHTADDLGPFLPVSLDHFRQGMRRLTGAVNLVTTMHEGDIHGLTATAVCSLSGLPPRLLACVNLAGRTFDHILHSRRMAVNVLAHRHIELARRFANMTDVAQDQRFRDADWRRHEDGAPLLVDALVSFDCKVEEIFVTPSHGVVIGEIRHVVFGPEDAPLLYANGQFATVQQAG